jgi:hypothetical protein
MKWPSLSIVGGTDMLDRRTLLAGTAAAAVSGAVPIAASAADGEDAALIDAERRMLTALVETNTFWKENPDYNSDEMPEPLDRANDAAEEIRARPARTISGSAVKLRLLLIECMGLDDLTCDGGNFRAIYGAICTLEELGARKAEIRLSDNQYHYPEPTGGAS